MTELLAIVDGTIWLEEQEEDFVLLLEESNKKISEDLQAIFLAEEQEFN